MPYTMAVGIVYSIPLMVDRDTVTETCCDRGRSRASRSLAGQVSIVLALRHPAVFITKGLPPPGPLLIHTLFDCRYPSIASAPFSRPRPEAL